MPIFTPFPVRLLFWPIAATLALSAGAAAGDSSQPLIGNPDGREVIRLDGEWHTIVDPYDKPLIMSEFGAGALAGKHGDPLERWTEEYQESVYRYQIDMLRKVPSLSGVSPWILVDFRSPRRPLPDIQDFWNRKGLISNEGQKKKAFFLLQSFYQSLE